MTAPIPTARLRQILRSNREQGLRPYDQADLAFCEMEAILAELIRRRCERCGGTGLCPDCIEGHEDPCPECGDLDG